MTTVIRVRRKRNTDAVENLVLPLKRAKVNEPTGRPGSQSAGANGQDENKAVFVFAGTVERKNQPISIHIQSALRRASIGLQPKKPTKATQQSVKEKTESHRMGAREKARTKQKAASRNRRLRVVDKARGLKLHELDKDAKVYQSPSRRPPAVANGGGRLARPGSAGKDADRVFALYDIVHDESEKDGRTTTTTTKTTKTTSKSKKSGSDEITCNSVQMTREKVVIGEDILQESEYVYDLYYTDCAEFDFDSNEGSMGMRSDRDDLVYEYFGSDAPRAGLDDDDDENDEGNWRNDYPDEDPEHKSGTDRDMFDEHLDDYRYASSEDEDLVAQYSKCNLGSRGGDLSDSDIDAYDL